MKVPNRPWAAVPSAIAASLPAVPFALLPVYEGLGTLAPSFPPDPFIVTRAILLAAALTVAFCGSLLAAGVQRRAATSAAAATCLALGLYPAVKHFVDFAPMASISPALFGVAYLLGCLGLTIVVARMRPAVANPVYYFVRTLSIIVFAWLGLRTWAYYGVLPRAEAMNEPAKQELHTTLDVRADTAKPDVYHIVLDGFGRPDVLRAMYDLDLSGFLQALKDRGFEVGDNRGFANYPQTYLSLASMLNVNYLDRLGIAASDAHSREPAHALIQRSSVMQAFKRLGYRIRFAGSIYSATRTHALADECACDYPLVGEFESLVFLNTPFADVGFGGADYAPHRNKVLRTFDTLESIADEGGPRFLFAHVMAPHPPFVFDAKGNPIAAPRPFSLFDGSMYQGTGIEYTQGYANQARYVAGRLLQAIDRFLEVSRDGGRDAVIIVHGDHGPRARFSADDASATDGRESLPVLLAIRWARTAPAATASPPESLVNVYRSLFRRYFETNLELLPDRAFISSFSHPYRYVEIDPRVLNGSHP